MDCAFMYSWSMIIYSSSPKILSGSIDNPKPCSKKHPPLGCLEKDDQNWHLQTSKTKKEVFTCILFWIHYMIIVRHFTRPTLHPNSKILLNELLWQSLPCIKSLINHLLSSWYPHIPLRSQLMIFFCEPFAIHFSQTALQWEYMFVCMRSWVPWIIITKIKGINITPFIHIAQSQMKS